MRMGHGMLSENMQLADEAGTVITAAERQRKRALGIYYTPRQAAEILARWAIRSVDDRVLEPSFGGCAMLSAAVTVFTKLGNQQPANQLFGYDIDDEAFEHLARMGINNKQGNFRHQNFLLSDSSGIKVDAVLANPPFISYQRLDSEQRLIIEEIRKEHLPTMHRKASLWAYFLLHSLSFLRTGGRMAFVLPNSIGMADYSREILKFLEHKFASVELIHVAEQLFIQTGADERVTLLLLDDYLPESVNSRASIKVYDVKNIQELEKNKTFDDIEKNESGMKQVRESASGKLSSLEGISFYALGDIADIKIGEVVGDIKFFVKTKKEWYNKEIYDEYLAPLLTRSAQIPGLSTAGATIDGRIPDLLMPPKDVSVHSINEYLDKYDENAKKSNRTFSKRSEWFKCSYSTEADAFIGSMNHELAKIVGNDARISSSNAFYKIIIHGSSEYGRWLPAISLTTPMRLSAELFGRIRGSGGIKLEPSDVKKLIIPVNLPDLSYEEFISFQQKLEILVQAGEIESASHLADSYIYLRTGILDAAVLSDLRLSRLKLTRYRLGSACRIKN